MPVTDIIASTETLLNETVSALSAKLTGEATIPWGVEIFSGTSYEKLFDYIPEVMTKHAGKPVAVVMYAGSSYGNQPRRTANIAVLILVENAQAEAGHLSSRSYLDRCLKLLDEHISITSGIRIKWEAREDIAVDIAPNVECIKAVFEARDN